MAEVVNLIQAYGGSIAGLAGIWTAVCILWLIATFACAKLLGRRFAETGIIIASIFWMFHGFVWYYTIVQISAWDLINSVHLGETEKRQQLFLIIKGATKLAFASSVALIVATIICLARRLNTRATEKEPDVQ